MNIDKWIKNGGIIQIEAWRRDGEDEGRICERLGISIRTLRSKCKKYPALASAMRHEKNRTDIMVENAVLKRALGYSTTEVKTVEKANGQMEVTTTEKEVPPDLSAATTWLKNRCPERWNEKSGKNTVSKAVDMVLGGIDNLAQSEE